MCDRCVVMGVEEGEVWGEPLDRAGEAVTLSRLAAPLAAERAGDDEACRAERHRTATKETTHTARMSCHSSLRMDSHHSLGVTHKRRTSTSMALLPTQE